jgi:hypothetical protein
MNNENTYEYRIRSDYNINSNPNIFPNRTPQPPKYSNKGLTVPSNSKIGTEEDTSTVQSQSNLSNNASLDPLTKMSQSFNNFALANKDTSLNTNKQIPQPFIPSNAIAKNDERIVTLQKNTLGEQRLGTFAYPYVYSEPGNGAPFLQPPQSNLIENPIPLYLDVESIKRDRDQYPNPAQYVYPLVNSNNNVDTPGERYKNITEISLESAVLPNNNNIFNQPYLLLQINEFTGHYDSASVPCRKSFAKLYLKAAGSFVRMDKENSDPMVRVFYPAPKASLDRLSISILNPDGTLFNFGTDTAPPQDPNPLLQNYFTFKITTTVPDIVDTIGHRNP